MQAQTVVLQGRQGITGSQGITGTGAQGIQGVQGIQGITGSQGITGTGSQGIQGIQGITGSQGITGAGLQGIQGIQGITGVQGLTGIQGISGTGGSQGIQGSQGVQGITGSTGPGTSITATNDTTTTLLYPVMVGSSGSPQVPKVTTTKLSFNAATGSISANDVTADTSTFGDVAITGNYTGASWTANGVKLDSGIGTHTDTSSTAASIIAIRTINSFRTPTIASTNAITVTNASTVRIDAAPVAGTNTTITNTHALHVATGRTYFQGAGSATIPALAIGDLDSGFYSSAAGTINFATNGASRAAVSSTGLAVTGVVTATGEVTAFFSDSRLKTVTSTITNAVERLMSINGVYYTANGLAAALLGEDTTVQKVGLLAQEVEAIMPEVIRAAPFDVDASGNSISGENYKTIQYERLIPLLVEAIKELKLEINELKK